MSWRSQGRVAAANLCNRGRVRSRSRLRMLLKSGLLGRIGRPSVARAAWSRCRLPEGLRPRCSCERRPPSEPEDAHRIVLPRGLPGIGIVRSAFGRREVVPAQCRARHAPVSRLSGVLSSKGFGVEETPGHGPDVVEDVEGGFRSCRVDGICADEESQVSVDFLS